MQTLNLVEIEAVGGSGATGADVVTGAALGRALSGAGAAFGEGIALGMEGGAWLGPAGAVIGAAIGAGVVWYHVTHMTA